MASFRFASLSLVIMAACAGAPDAPSSAPVPTVPPAGALSLRAFTVGDCTAASLVAAINNANATGGGSISLQSGCTYDLTAIDNFWYGPTALPPIESAITIDGGTTGATITRDVAAPPMRLFYVASSGRPPYVAGQLTLVHLTLSNGFARGGDGGAGFGGGGGGLGAGGAIYADGNVSIDRSLFVGNRAQGGNGGARVGTSGAGGGGGGMGGNGGTPSAGGGCGGGGFQSASDPGGVGAGGAGVTGTEGGRTGSGGTSIYAGDNGGDALPGGVPDDLGGSGGGGPGRYGFYGGGEAGGHSGAFGQGGPGASIPIGLGDAGAGGAGFGGNGGNALDGGGGGAFGGGGGCNAHAGTDAGQNGHGGGGGVGGGGGGGGNGSANFAGGAGGFGGGGGGGNGGGRATGGFGGGAGGTKTSTGAVEAGGGGDGLGGAIFIRDGSLYLSNSTLTANTAAGGAAGGSDDATVTDGVGTGGAVFAFGGQDYVTGVTIASNVADSAALVAADYDLVTFISMENSIVYGTTTSSGGSTADVAGFARDSCNVDFGQASIVGSTSAGSCHAPKSSADPLLGALAANGGATETMAPLWGSPARGAGDVFTCTELRVDQRDVARGTHSCSIGAFDGPAPATATTTTLSAAPNPAHPDDVVTLTGAVTGTSATPTGEVDFYDGLVLEGSAALDGSGEFSTTLTFDTTGTHALTAEYDGDSANLASTSAPVSEAIDAIGTTTTASTNPTAPFRLGTAYSIGASIAATDSTSLTPTGDVMFELDGSAFADVTLAMGVAGVPSGPTLTIGTHRLDELYSGDANFGSSSTHISIEVDQAIPTIALAVVPSTLVAGEAASVVVTVGGAQGTPTGTVTLTDGTTAVGTIALDAGSATFAVAWDAGSHFLNAVYNGDPDYVGVSVQPVIGVAQASSAVTVTPSSTAPTYGDSVTFTAAVTPVSPSTFEPTGSVTFTVDGVTQVPDVALADVSGTAEAAITPATLAAGSHTIGATYHGSTDFTGSAGQDVQGFAKATPTIAFTLSPSSVLTTQTETIRVTVGSAISTPTGTVTIAADGSQVAMPTLAAGVATATPTLAAGTHAIDVHYAGDTNFNAVDATEQQLGVSVTPTTTAVATSGSPADAGTSVTFTATVSANSPGTGTPDGNVQFFADGSAIGAEVTVSGGSASVTTSSLLGGTHTILAAYGGSSLYGLSSGSAQQVIDAAVIGATPDPLALTANVGSSGSAQLAIANSGDAPLVVTGATLSGTNPGDFAVTTALPITIAAGATAPLTVSFTPLAVGARTATLSLASNDPATPSTEVTLNGTATSPAIALDPLTVAFGDVRAGTTGSASLVISNTGTGPLTITSIALGGTDAAVFGDTLPTLPLVLAAAGSASLPLTFSPIAVGAASATLTIVSDDPSGMNAVVPLSGNGVSPMLGLAPATVAFGGQIVARTSDARTVTISNSGTSALRLSALQLTGAQAADFALVSPPTLPIAIAAGSAQAVQVTATPSMVGAGSATLAITTDDPTTPNATVALTEVGVSKLFTLSPTNLDFGTVKTAAAPTTQPVTLTNTGGDPLVLVDGALTGTDAAAFSVSSAAGTVMPGDQIMVNVTFTPGAAGTYTATLTLASADGSIPAGTVGLTATVVSSLLSASPMSLSFGSIGVGQTSATLPVTVTNVGSAPVTIASATADSAQFAIAGLDTTDPIAPGGTSSFTVAFAPTAAGTQAGHVSVTLVGQASPEVSVQTLGFGVVPTTDAGPRPADAGVGDGGVVRGDGALGGDSTPAVGNGSGCGCDTDGAPSPAALALGLAVLLALVRRRR